MFEEMDGHLSSRFDEDELSSAGQSRARKSASRCRRHAEAVLKLIRIVALDQLPDLGSCSIPLSWVLLHEVVERWFAGQPRQRLARGNRCGAALLNSSSGAPRRGVGFGLAARRLHEPSRRS